ncbi:MAG: hypothetical protein C5B54_05670 [Acidobacteria bacterium]|nr:MAG: hypothetical protein C5B54_05670 [Acidobacteriota bacterium]
MTLIANGSSRQNTGGACCENGFSLLETLVVLALIGLMLLFAGINLFSTARQSEFEEFARKVYADLEQCRWKSWNERVYAGAVFKAQSRGFSVSYYLDGNGNGIRTADIDKQKDILYRGPLLLQEASGDIGVGTLDGSDPVRFGRSDILSFSPNGDSSSGTLYLVCRSQKQMYSIVIYGPTARMTLWKFSNQQWQMVGDR